MTRFQKLPWEPKIQNKYSLDWEKIKTLQVGNRELIKKFALEIPNSKARVYRNDLIDAWCFLGTTSDRMAESQFWIGIYDEKSTKETHRWNVSGNFDFHLTAYMEMCHYQFTTFFNPDEINGNRFDLEIQEKFLATLNELIDLGILVLPAKRNILLESCFYDSKEAEKNLEEYKKKTGLSTMEIACGVKFKE